MCIRPVFASAAVYTHVAAARGGVPVFRSRRCTETCTHVALSCTLRSVCLVSRGSVVAHVMGSLFRDTMFNFRSASTPKATSPTASHLDRALRLDTVRGAAGSRVTGPPRTGSLPPQTPLLLLYYPLAVGRHRVHAPLEHPRVVVRAALGVDRVLRFSRRMLAPHNGLHHHPRSPRTEPYHGSRYSLVG